jgi:cell wall-associated NlpC family hydrolase
MSGKHRRHKGQHRARNPHVRDAAGAVVVAAGAATMLIAPDAHADPGVNWDAIAACESGGNWAINTGNGYLGGLQWTQATWHANGGTGSPANASREQQIAVANRVIATQGIARGLANWPVCGKHASASSKPVVTTATASAPKHAAPAPAVTPQHAAPSPLERQPDTNAMPTQSSYVGPTTDYVVAQDDTLTLIAQTHQVPGGWPQIATANLDTITNPDQIWPGQHLKLPASADPGLVPRPVKLSSPQPGVKALVTPVPADSAPTVKAESMSGGIAARAVSAALNFRGTPYLYGGNGKGGIDCSGLVAAAFRAAGISMPRTAAAQSTMGRTVSLSELRAGDLLFYRYGSEISHVAIATDSGHIVEASQPGQPVGQRAVYTSNLVVIKRLVG